jgi:predicted metal-dependent hydrolase
MLANSATKATSIIRIQPPTAITLMTDVYPEQYLHGLRLFNEEEFFECHDVLEELWSETLGEEKKFYQGLIQASVALFHFGNENLGGARKLYDAAREKLAPYRPRYMGIDLEKFLADFQHCFQELLDATDAYPTGVELQDDRVPKIPPPDANL